LKKARSELTNLRLQHVDAPQQTSSAADEELFIQQQLQLQHALDVARNLHHELKEAKRASRASAEELELMKAAMDDAIEEANR
jgi:hypothetical protein